MADPGREPVYTPPAPTVLRNPLNWHLNLHSVFIFLITTWPPGSDEKGKQGYMAWGELYLGVQVANLLSARSLPAAVV